MIPSTIAAGRVLGSRAEIQTEGMSVVAVAAGIERMGVSVEATAARLCPSESRLLHAAERRLLHLAPIEDRGRLATRMWVRKDAAFQLLGYGLTVDPEQVEAGHSGDQGTIRLEHPDGGVASVHVTDVPVGGDYVCAIATPCPPEEVRYWGRLESRRLIEART